MSPEANAVIMFMVRELSHLKYGTRAVIEWCYASAISPNYGLAKPIEPKDEIIDKVIEILNSGVEKETT